MFKDMALSRDLVTAYREGLENRSPAPDDKGKRKAGGEDDPKATFLVLQASSWPFSPRDKDVDLPPHVSDQTSRLVSRLILHLDVPDVGTAQQICRLLQEEAREQGVELGSFSR